jgi:hypothetical protein
MSIDDTYLANRSVNAYHSLKKDNSLDTLLFGRRGIQQGWNRPAESVRPSMLACVLSVRPSLPLQAAQMIRTAARQQPLPLS